MKTINQIVDGFKWQVESPTVRKDFTREELVKWAIYEGILLELKNTVTVLNGVGNLDAARLIETRLRAMEQEQKDFAANAIQAKQQVQ